MTRTPPWSRRDVVGGDVAVEEHLVGEAAAATGPHGHPERQGVVALGGDELTNLVGCTVGHCDHCGSSRAFLHGRGELYRRSP